MRMRSCCQQCKARKATKALIQQITLEEASGEASAAHGQMLKMVCRYPFPATEVVTRDTTDKLRLRADVPIMNFARDFIGLLRTDKATREIFVKAACANVTRSIKRERARMVAGALALHSQRGGSELAGLLLRFTHEAAPPAMTDELDRMALLKGLDIVTSYQLLRTLHNGVAEASPNDTVGLFCRLVLEGEATNAQELVATKVEVAHCLSIRLQDEMLRHILKGAERSLLISHPTKAVPWGLLDHMEEVACHAARVGDTGAAPPETVQPEFECEEHVVEEHEKTCTFVAAPVADIEGAVDPAPTPPLNPPVASARGHRS